MLTTLEKVHRLEAYLALENSSPGPVVERTVTKPLQREYRRMNELKTRLDNQLQEFERQYQLASPEFYACYEQGNMGDDMDFVEWAATFEMLANVKKRVTILHSSTFS